MADTSVSLTPDECKQIEPMVVQVQSVIYVHNLFQRLYSHPRFSDLVQFSDLPQFTRMCGAMDEYMKNTKDIVVKMRKRRDEKN